MRFPVYVLLVAVLGLSALTALQFRAVDNTRSQSRQQTCRAFDKFNEVIIGQIRSGEKVLPTLAYYKAHPEDMVRVLASDEKTITALQNSLPDYC